MCRKPGVAAGAIGLALIVSCDSPSRPSPPTSPPPPPANVVTDLRIEGPANVAPGASVQFRAIATFRDGGTTDVAPQAVWTSTNRSVLSVTTGGLATGERRGEAQLMVRFQGVSRQTPMFVLEDGTFRVRGRVTESGAGLEGARVDVVSGTGQGLTATTDAIGGFAIYGVAGEAAIEAALDGFDKERRTIVVTGHTTADLQLRPTVEPSDLRGDWRLSVAASSTCGADLPADAASRSYNVRISQNGTALDVAVTSVPLAAEFLHMSGRVVDRTVTINFPVDDFYYFYYGVKFYVILEFLGPERFLAISGAARGDRTGATVAGSLQGEFSLYRTSDGFGSVRNRTMSCLRDDHTFRLDRD